MKCLMDSIVCCQYFTNLSHIDFRPGKVGQLGPGLDEDLWKVMIEVTGGDHVETHQDVEGQSEHGQVPAAVNGCNGA